MSMSSSDSLRPQQRLHWVRDALHDPVATLERASVDAGQRSYWRVTSSRGSHVLMDSPPALEDPRPWLRMHALLHSHGVRVPHVEIADADAGFLLLEDLGGPTLARTIATDTADAHSDADAWMDRAITQLLRLQQIPVPAGFGSFGEALLQRDAGLFDAWFLQRHLGLQLDCGQVEQLQLVQRRLMDNALAQPTVLTHRDFMPRNLMPVADGPAVLDFQDLVSGPIAYDIISLFKDAFLSWPLERVDGWLRHYHQRARDVGLPVGTLDRFVRDADWLGIQRHLKILGIFSRLHYRDGKSHYLEDVPRFISYLDEVLPRHPELRPLQDLLDGAIKPALAARVAAADASADAERGKSA